MLVLRNRVVALTSLILLGATLLVATAPVPRASSELTFLEPSGKQTSLSSFHGKVVVVEFLLMNCPHCAPVTLVIAKLHKELGPRGFQPIGIAFDNDAGGGKVTDFARRLGITYPVGYTSSKAVDSYLGRKSSEQFMAPQIVVIDRQGIIRAQSHPIRESSLEDESHLQSNRRSLERKQAQLGEEEPLTSFTKDFVIPPQSRMACMSLYLQGVAEGALFT